MADRRERFRIALRRFGPFEVALAKQWDSFERRNRTGLELEAIALDLHPLYDALFANRGLQHGEWDIALLSTDWLAEAADSRGLLDLAPHIDRDPPDGYPQAWSNSLLRLQSFGGRILGTPYHDGPECLIYRRDLFEDARERERFAREFGAELTVPSTWEEFRRVARFFTRPRNSLYGTAFAAFPDGHNTVYDFCLQLWTRGGELFESSGRMVLETREACQALDFYRSLLNDRSTVHPRSWEFDSVQSGLAFAAGEIAVMVNWFGYASMAETIAESKVRGCVAVAPIPCEVGSRISLNAYWILGVPIGSPHRGLAWKFLRHCASPEMDKLLTLEGAIGCRKSTWLDADVNSVIPFYHCLETLHEGARELPRLRNWSQLAAIIDRMVLDAINSDELTVRILQKAQARANEIAVTPGEEFPSYR